MSTGTIVWTISFRLPGQVAQAEVKKYTQEAADKVAGELELLGGVVVVTEEVEEGPIEDNIEPAPAGHANLNWDK